MALDDVEKNLSRYGIGVFNQDGNGDFKIQRLDDVGQLWLDENEEYLLTDRKAVAICKLLAEDGNPYAIEALRLCNIDINSP